MATAFIGNLLVSNIKTVISASTSTGQTSGANQVLPSNISARTNYTTAISVSTTTTALLTITYDGTRYLIAGSAYV